MVKRCLLALSAVLFVLLLSFPFAVGTSAQAPTIRLVVKLRSPLASEIESGLPLAPMALVPGQSGNPNVEAFLSRHAARRLAPMYPDIVRRKKVNGLSDLQIATATRQRFANRASRLRVAFQPPEISRTYVLEVVTATRAAFDATLADLRADPDVEYAEEDHIYSANAVENDPYLSSFGTWGQNYDDLWGIKKIGAPAAWDTNTGSGIIVAVVDTGTDYNHPDISGNIWTNTKEIAGNGIDDDHNGFIDDVRGWDFIGSTSSNPQESSDPIDHYGHGTHVAGTIAAMGNNGIGVIGVAWNSHVMAVKGLDDQGFGLSSTLGPAILYAANNGADVINASWGGPSYSQTIADAISYAYNLGAVIVVSAGNNSSDARSFYPAALPDVITIAATDPTDSLAGFSNFGSKIDAAAPGVDILSLQAAGTNLGISLSPGYTRLSGTSMAAPHVSGLAALILSQNPSYSNEDVRQVVRVSATDLGTSGYDLTYGYGRINASAAVGNAGVLEAKITSPVDGIITRGVLTISGVARGAGFSHYVLEYGSGALPTTWTSIQTSSTPAAGTLGVFDASTLSDGVYDVRLTVFNTLNQAFVDRIQVVIHAVIISSPVPPPAPIASTTFKNGVTIPIIGTAVNGSFQSFQVEWVSGLDPSSGWQSAGMTLTGGGHSPVSSGVLANWDTSSISGPGYYTIRLTLNSSQLAPQHALTMVYLEPDLLSSNWPQFVIQGPGLGAGVVPALDADGTIRLLMESPKGPFAGVSQFWSFPMNGPPQGTLQAGAGGFMQPSVANFEGGSAEEAAIIDFSDLELIHPDGSLNVLSTNPDVWYVGSQTVVEDLAGDGQLEILGYGLDYNTPAAYVSAWRPDGTQLNSNFPIRLTFQNPVDGQLDRNPVLVGDINGDGKKKIIAMEDLSSTTFTLRLFGNDGSPLKWGVPTLPGILTAMAAADLDNNGKLETIVASNTSTQTSLHVIQPDGTERPGWPLTFPNSGISSQSYLAIGDLNRDGSKEIVYTHAGLLYVLKSNGTVFPGAWPLNAGTGTGTAFGYNALTIGDVDGDGFPEIVTVLNTLAGTSDPFFTIGSFGNETLLAIRRDGTVSKSWQLNASNGCFTQFYPAPSIGDFNQDGITDIAVAYLVSGNAACSAATGAGIVTILSTGAKFDPSLNDWPLVRHDPRNTSVLTPPPATSTTSLSASANPAVYGQQVTFSSVVAALSNLSVAGTPGGNVVLSDGGTNLGTCALTSGSCIFATSTLSTGNHTIGARYSGDSKFATSSSAGMSELVSQAASTTTVSSSLNPSVAGQSVTLTATVAAVAPGAGMPTGTVTFNDAGNSIGAASLNLNGQAILSATNFISGTHTITATYSGDGNFTVSSTSAPVSQVVNAADFSLSVSSAQTVNAGSSATFTITVTPNPPPFNLPVGTFGCSGLPQGATCQFALNSVTLGNSSAPITLTISTTSRTLSMTALPRGSDGIVYRPLPWPILLAFGIVGIIGLTGKRRTWKTRSLLALLFLGCLVWFGCAGGSGSSGPTTNPSGTPAGTYEITVTAVANGGGTHSAIATLKVI